MVPAFGGPTGQRTRQEDKSLAHVLRPRAIWVLGQVLCLGKLESFTEGFPLAVPAHAPPSHWVHSEPHTPHLRWALSGSISAGPSRELGREPGSSPWLNFKVQQQSQTSLNMHL